YTGSPIDFSDYFHVYIEGTAFDNSQISQYFSFTYYADENGYPGEKLATAPYKVGTYFIRAQLMPTKPGYSMDAWSDVTNRVEYLMTATAFTRYHIAASGVAVDDGYDDYIDFGGNVGELCEHVFGEWQNEVAADCTHTGIKAHKDCTLCNRHFDADGNEIRDLRIPARHTLKAVPKQDSTCTAQGTLAHEHCSVCGKDFIDGAEKSADELIIAATGHSYGGWSIVKPATCSAAGSKKRICTKCNHEEIQIVAIDANAHTWGEWTIDKAATCTEKGEKTRVCSHNSAHRQTQEIDAEGHSWNPDATRVEPTCTTNGYIRGTCMVCGTTTTEVLPARGHELAQHAAKAATCTEIGWNAYETCLHCDYTTYSEIAATGHSYGRWSIVKSSTCTATGSKKRICTKCNHEEIQTIAIDVNAHTWGEWTIDKAATCTEKGEKTRVCVHNSAHRQTQEIAAAGHSWNAEATRVEPTCTVNGYVRGTCMVCGTTTTEVLPARGHELAQHAAKAATCTEIGWNAYETCLHCGYTTYSEIAATGHTEVGDAAVLATCTKKGVTAGSHCSVCNKVITAQNEIPALGHDYDNEFQVDNQPTVTEKGS
ncbi:MAG: hypothetical protein K2I79_01325, partial [Clostridia bacterium]|nr:hypothetical protein [Clostridia bacterium]